MNMNEQLIVTRSADGEEFPNLRGVFNRVFPIAMDHVMNSGRPQTVNYCGERFVIALALNP
jgi:hypothetical protein